MSKNYYPASINATSFNCPHCNVFANQTWGELEQTYTYVQGQYSTTNYNEIKNYRVSQCQHCDDITIWKNDNYVYPFAQAIAFPHEDMPDELKKDFNEASDIFSKSPRGATALLRLVIQKLMPHLGEKGKNINEDIAALVKKGLNPKVQQALDYCRVIGNYAVHPAELNIQDTPEIAKVLFEMINFIIEDQISRPKQIESFYNLLPENARNHINERDKLKD